MALRSLGERNCGPESAVRPFALPWSSVSNLVSLQAAGVGSALHPGEPYCTERARDRNLGLAEFLSLRAKRQLFGR
jgi:hypothetical protein